MSAKPTSGATVIATSGQLVVDVAIMISFILIYLLVADCEPDELGNRFARWF
jgi:hypothetical protein